MECSQIPIKEYSGILNMTQGLNIDKLKKIMTESMTEKVLKDIDGRTGTKPPWQRSKPFQKKKPFHKKRTSSAKMADEVDEEDDDEDYYDDDVQAIDEEEEWDEDTWYGEDDWEDEEEEEEWEEDQVAHIDEEGYFHADEDTIDLCDEQLAKGDEEFCAILTTYTEARGALARARIARGFYPVVVPADSGPQPRFGRKGSGQSKGKRKGKGKGKRPRPKARARASAN